MINKLQIKNFKCFLNQEINLGKLTVFAGANGVGKSSVIQSFLIVKRYFEEYNKNQKSISIALNDKKNTFLELGSSKELLNSDAPNTIISFSVYTDRLMKLIEFDTKRANTVLFSGDSINSEEEDEEEKELMDFFSLSNTLHYLNAERLGPRNILELQDDVKTVGFQGEFTGQVIADAMKEEKGDEFVKVITEKRFDQDTSPLIHRQIEAWTNFALPDVQIQIKTFEEINKVRIGIRKKGANTDFLHPNNIGFGISYVLPIVVTGLIAQRGDFVIIENPEAHLHPFSQSRVGQFLAKMAGAGVQILVETHSEHVINGIRIGALKNFINHSDVIVNFFSQKSGEKVNVHKIELNKDADLKKWPYGFFDQIQQDFAEIMKLRNQKKL